VAIDSRKAREGRFVDILGWYNPIEKPAKVNFDEEKIFQRLDEGATVSDTVASLFRNTGLTDKYRKLKSGDDVSEVVISETITERTKKRKSKTAKAE
jgi:small subunit ribosomal protein S16